MNLWNPHAITSGNGEGSLICPLRKHTGSVKGLEFNSFSPNLLASGAADGDLCIWDLANPAQPSLYPALKGGSSQAAGQGVDITHLAWNRKVQHILASTSSGGTTVVWDLKRQRQVISFTDPNMKRRCSALQWNPEVATQLVVASDDDRSPTLQVWDLRNSISPLREFVGHTKGVLSLSWCEADSSLLLSSGKDNRTICWDTELGEPLCELPSSGNWNFDVQWCPRAPGVFSAASFDGKVSLYNLTDCTSQEKEKVVNPDFSVTYKSKGPATPLKKAPSWLKKPCGVNCGFGGRMVAFHTPTMPDGSKGNSLVSISQLPVSRETPSMEEFETAMADKANIPAYCEAKAADSVSEDEAEVWNFLNVLYQDDARRTLLKILGHEPPTPAEATAATDEAVEGATEGLGDLAINDGKAKPEDAPAEGGDGSDFFDNLPEKAGSVPPSPKPQENGVLRQGFQDKAPGLGQDEDLDESEIEIQKAIFVGDYETAVAACLEKGRLADALVLASIGGTELWDATQREYMRRANLPYMKIVAAISEDNLEKLVDDRSLRNWKDTLAILCTYAKSQEWTVLCKKLAVKLDDAGMQHPAVLCYICAGCTDEAVRYWSNAAVKQHGSLSGSVEALQAVVEKSVVLGSATGQAGDTFASVMSTYAQLLASQGKLDEALKYLGKVPGEPSDETAVLKDRLYRAGARSSSGAAPASPFEAQPITSTSAPATQPATQHQQAGHAPQQAGYAQQQAGYAQQQAGYAQQQAVYAQQQAGYGQQQQTSPYGHQSSPYGQPQSSPYGQPQQPQTFQPAAPQPQTFQPAAPQPQAVPSYAQQAPAKPKTAYDTAAQPSFKTRSSYESQPAPTFQHQQPAQPSAGQYTPPAGAATMQYAAAGQAATFQPAPSQAPMAPTAAQAAATTVQQPATFVPQARQFSSAVPLPAQPSVSPQPVQQGFGQTAPAPAPAPAPAQAKPVKPVAPANTNISNVDTSKISDDLKPAIASLTQLYQTCAQGHPARKKELDDVSKKLGVLFFKLNIGDVKPSVKASLIELSAALAQGDSARAGQIHVQLTTTDWDECGPWLTALKRLMKLSGMR